MKFLSTVLFLMLFSFFLQGQSSVNIQINNLLQGEDFQNGVPAMNDLENNFKVERLQYYLSGFSITHDQGKVTELPDLYFLVDLVNKTDPVTIELGNHDIQTLEGVSFHLGVDAENNHGDPALWDANHPLAPKLPSMHWGWNSGYRFIALEGKSGPNIDQEMQFHCIGDEFYKPMSFDVAMTGQTSYTVNLDAEYSNLIKGIDVSEGIILHGADDEIITLADNVIQHVFTLSDLTSSTIDDFMVDFKIFPNPSAGELNVELSNQDELINIFVYDILGQLIHESTMSSQTQLNIGQLGVYFVALKDDNGILRGTRRIVIE